MEPWLSIPLGIALCFLLIRLICLIPTDLRSRECDPQDQEDEAYEMSGGDVLMNLFIFMLAFVMIPVLLLGKRR